MLLFFHYLWCITIMITMIKYFYFYHNYVHLSITFNWNVWSWTYFRRSPPPSSQAHRYTPPWCGHTRLHSYRHTCRYSLVRTYPGGTLKRCNIQYHGGQKTVVTCTCIWLKYCWYSTTQSNNHQEKQRKMICSVFKLKCARGHTKLGQEQVPLLCVYPALSFSHLGHIQSLWSPPYTYRSLP